MKTHRHCERTPLSLRGGRGAPDEAIYKTIILCFFFLVTLSCSDNGIKSPIAVSTLEGVQGDKDQGVITLKIQLAIKKEEQTNYRIDSMTFDVVTNTLRSLRRVGINSILDVYPQTSTQTQVADFFYSTAPSLILTPGSTTQLSRQVRFQYQNGLTGSKILPSETMFVTVEVTAQPMDKKGEPDGDPIKRTEYLPITFGPAN